MVVNERKSKTMQKYLGAIFSNLCYFSFHGITETLLYQDPTSQTNHLPVMHLLM